MSEEHLEDGASPRTPPGDNLLLSFARTQAEAYAAYAGTLDAEHADDDDLGLSMSDCGAATPFGNTAVLVRPVGPDRTSALVERLSDFYGRREGGPYILFSPWPTADLRPDGFHLVGHPPLMLRPAGERPPPRTGLRIEPVRTLDQLDDFERVMVDGFPVEELQPWQPRCLVGPTLLDSRWQLFLGYEGDRAVATAASYRAEAAIVEQVAVLPEGRGQGYGFDITSAATASDVPTLLIASDLGQPVYERLGYLRMLRYTLWVGTR